MTVSDPHSPSVDSSRAPSGLYRVLRPLLFSLDPETAHELVFSLAPLAHYSLVQRVLRSIFTFEDPRLAVTAFGRTFANPFFLAAGLDKSCRALELLSTLGFGAIELGSVTAQAQLGNPRPRIFRFPADGALINRMGNPNLGAAAFAENLRAVRSRIAVSATATLPPVGLNIGKSTETPNDRAFDDYAETFRAASALVDYVTLNVSCPNVEHYSALQQRESLRSIFASLQGINSSKIPILVKLSPDLTEPQIDDALECCLATGIAGVIATNTTVTREGLSQPTDRQGGMSGCPLFSRSVSRVSYIFRATQGRLPIVGVGGISSAHDAITMMKAGASLLQLYTALVYQGPSVVKRFKKDLLAIMDRDSVRHISEYRPTVGPENVASRSDEAQRRI